MMLEGYRGHTETSFFVAKTPHQQELDFHLNDSWCQDPRNLVPDSSHDHQHPGRSRGPIFPGPYSLGQWLIWPGSNHLLGQVVQPQGGSPYLSLSWELAIGPIIDFWALEVRGPRW
jgi:hypothetical protein